MFNGFSAYMLDHDAHFSCSCNTISYTAKEGELFLIYYVQKKGFMRVTEQTCYNCEDVLHIMKIFPTLEAIHADAEDCINMDALAFYSSVIPAEDACQLEVN